MLKQFFKKMPLLWLILPALVFHGGTRLSLLFSGTAPLPFWYFPSSLGTALILLGGPGVLPAVFLNSFLSGPLWGFTWPLALGWALIETAQTGGAWFLYKHVRENSKSLVDSRGLREFIIFASLFPSLIGAALRLILMKDLLGSPAWEMFPGLILADMALLLLTAPPLLTAPFIKGTASSASAVTPVLTRKAGVVLTLGLTGMLLAGNSLETPILWMLIGLVPLYVAANYGFRITVYYTSPTVFLSTLLPLVLSPPEAYLPSTPLSLLPYHGGILLMTLVPLVLGRMMGDLRREIRLKHQTQEELTQYKDKLEELVLERTEKLNHARDVLITEKRISDTLIDGLPGLFFLASPQGKTIRVNRNLETITGYTHSELSLMNAADLFLQGRGFVEAKIMEIMTHGKVQFEADLLTRNGGSLPFLFAMSQVEMEGQHFIIGTGTDLSDLRLAMNEVRKLSRVLEQSPSSIVITDREGLIEYVNPGFTEITGYPREEVVARNPRILKSGYLPDTVYEELWKTIARGETWRGEFINKKKNGEIYWESASISPVKDQNNRITHYLAIKENITERKVLEEELLTSEERYRALFEQAGDAIILQDGETGELIDFNDAACLNLGYTREEFSRLDLALFSLPVNPEDNRDKKSQEVRPGSQDDTGFIETIHRGKDGSEHHVWVNSRTILINGNRYRQSVWRDISDLKRMETELVAAKEAAESSAKSKATFLANMSHEIRTPLNSVIGFVELVLENNRIPEDQSEYLRKALGSAKNLLSLINEILEISKMEAGKLSLENRPIPLPRFIRSTVGAHSLAVERKGLDLHVHIPPTLTVCLMADPDKLRRVLINLLDNAVKFTEKGSVTVSLTDRSDGTIQFSIADTGIGLSEEERSAIFNPFTQADQSIARLYGGTGLGTTISQELVQLMGGEIWVDSEPGEGSTFHFTLPRQVVPCPEESPEGRHEFLDPQQPTLFRPSRRFKILMAEDVEENATLAAVRLAKQGHRVITVSNGTEAVEAYRTEPFDLILMDIHMPGMDGLEATRRIREITPPSAVPVPIIALTASVMEEDRKLYRKAGISGLIGKPILFQELFSLMEDLVPDGYGEPWRSEPEEKRTPKDSSSNPLDQKKALAMWQHPRLYRKALASFIDKYGNAPSRLEDLIREGGQEEAFRLAHNLKGLAGTLALARLQISAGLLDGALRKALLDPTDPLLKTLRKDLEEAVTAIEDYLESPAPPEDQNQQEPQ